MKLKDIGIKNVMVFELPCGIWADGQYTASSRTALVKWRSSLSDKLFQVYVNGRYEGTTLDSQQRRMLVAIPASFESPVRIEVFAVEIVQADTDFSDDLDYPAGLTGRVKITMLRSQSLPIDTTVQFYFDNGTGQIDYDNPLNDPPIRVWPVRQDKGGFGMSCFGKSDFGYDSSAAVGFGKGSFGFGDFGLDADTIEWISPSLDAGVYKFAVRASDRIGNQSNSIETEPLTVTPLPRPPKGVNIASFDKQLNQLVLTTS